MIEVSINGYDDEGLTLLASEDLEDENGLRLFAEHVVFHTFSSDHHVEIRWAEPGVPAEREPILAGWNWKRQEWLFHPRNIARAFKWDREN